MPSDPDLIAISPDRRKFFPSLDPLADGGVRRHTGTLKDAFLRLLPRSLLARLILIVLAIDGFAAAMAGGVIVYQARSATKVEIAAAMQLAELLVTDTIGLMRDTQSPLLLQTIDLHSESVRHVRFAVTDADGQPVQAQSSSKAPAQTAFSPEAPDWFSRLIAPPPEVKIIPVLVRNRLVGNVTVTSEPSDEIGEAWHYAHALLNAGVVLSLTVLLILALLFGRVLAPLTALATGLKGLEDHDYKVRLPRPRLHELAILTDHFNRTAVALEDTNAANRILNRKLLTAQDDERRRTALELHDEVGPCLFTLDVNASSIVGLTGKLADGGRIHERAEEVVALIKRVQGINRRVLDSLRPMGLGRIPLKECLVKLLVDFGDSGPTIVDSIGALELTYGRLVDLTIYRCMQEGLFNAIRHAQASRISLDVHERADAPRRVEISISDDGRGLRETARVGIGLTGMRERVEALCGTFELDTSGQGTRLRISVPVDADGEEADRLTSRPLPFEREKLSYY